MMARAASVKHFVKGVVPDFATKDVRV